MTRIYGNRTTKVAHNGNKGDACRKSAIKKGNAENLKSTADAEQKGYRLCRRCSWE